MKTTKLVTLKFTEEELKKILVDHLFESEQGDLGAHLEENDCVMEWEGDELVVSIDGEMEDEHLEEDDQAEEVCCEECGCVIDPWMSLCDECLEAKEEAEEEETTYDCIFCGNVVDIGEECSCQEEEKPKKKRCIRKYGSNCKKGK